MMFNHQRTGAARMIAMAIAVWAMLGGGAIGWMAWSRSPEQFYDSYLVAWMYWAGLSLGSLALVLLHNLSGGKWGEAIRPLARTAANVLPLMAILFLPIALEPRRIYEWADPSIVEHDAALQHKQPYLNVDSFQLRAVVYFALWFALLALLAWQERTSAAPETPADRRFRRLSGQGLALHGVAVTFAAVDWMMSLEPHWFSSIYGVIVFASQGLSALALAIVLHTSRLRRVERLTEHDVDSLHDLGKLLLGLVMFWAYVQFSQFLLIWYGNLPEEVVWYKKRIEGAWAPVALGLVALHFALPFVLLLSRRWKRDPKRLGLVALLILAIDWVAIWWMIKPAVEPERALGGLGLDLGLSAMIGGAWWIAFTILGTRSLALDQTAMRAEEDRHE